MTPSAARPAQPVLRQVVPLSRRDVLAGLGALAVLTACGKKEVEQTYPGETPEIDRLVRKYAKAYDMPESLIHRVIRRESGYNPRARNGPYYGLMQILPQTAKTMGYTGKPSGLLDAETNIKYGAKYLRGAWLVSHGSQDKAVYWYSHGYYYEAKKQGLLEETGLKG
jgi:soluble lytic murein transglycosylase-like protein